jgi:hypothetical protein
MGPGVRGRSTPGWPRLLLGGGADGKLGRGREDGAGIGLGAGLLLVRRASSAASLRCLYSFQHAGHRHSTTNVPFGIRVRVSRHPNWELISV